MSKALQIQLAREKRVMSYLAYSGLTPFVIGLGLHFWGTVFFGFTGPEIFTTYSVVILSFLCGILWGRSLHADENKLLYLIFSNVFALCAWAALLNNNVTVSLITLFFSYILVFLIEMRQPANVDKHYIYMRAMLTVMVSLLHLVMLFSL